jgi:hypothetical protein
VVASLQEFDAAALLFAAGVEPLVRGRTAVAEYCHYCSYSDTLSSLKEQWSLSMLSVTQLIDYRVTTIKRNLV